MKVLSSKIMDYNSLVKSYNTLSFSKQLRELLEGFYPDKSFSGLDKYELSKFINDETLKHYNGENVLKYWLAKEFINNEYIAAFEVKANTSRADFVAINGVSKSFEVKSRFDTLNRLSGQVVNYGNVFEYNTIVTDSFHLKKILNILPDYYGIWIYDKGIKTIYRNPILSPDLNPKDQIELLNKSELIKSFCCVDKAEILKSFDSSTINLVLKETLKKRYSKRWNFIQSNWNHILPIDIQFFFNTNVSPTIVYDL